MDRPNLGNKPHVEHVNPDKTARLRAFGNGLFWTALYALTLLIPTELTVEGQGVSFFWPGSGLAVAMAVCLGPWSMAGVFAINLLKLYPYVESYPAAAIAAGGLVLEAQAAAWLFQRVLNGDAKLGSRPDLYRFICAAAFAAPVIAATIGTLVYCSSGIVEWERGHTLWLCWWYGENLGILFAGPMLLGGLAPLRDAVKARPVEAATVLISTLAVSYAVFYASPSILPILRAPLALLPIPFMYWGATRLGIAFTSLQLLGFGIVVALGTGAGYGPFSPLNSATGMVVLWTYGQIVGGSALLMAGLLAERDNVRDALRVSEQRYRTLVESGPSVVYTFDHRDTLLFTYISPQCRELTGHAPEEFYAQRGLFAGMIHPEDLLHVAEAVRNSWQLKERIMLEYRLVRDDGSVRWIRDEAAYLASRADGPGIWQGVLVDVTQHREIAEAHRKTQELLAGIWESSAMAIFVLDTQGAIIVANPAAHRLMGFVVDTVTGHYYNEAKFRCETESGEPLPEDAYPFRLVMASQAPLSGYVHAIRDESGARRILSVDGAPLRDEEGRLAGAFFLVEDITERRHAEAQRESLEAQLRHAQKIEAVGQLAGGVAHDFNNLLQVIQGYTRLAMEERTSGEQRVSHLRNVCTATEKAAALTSQLLAFGRRQSLEKSDCDLNQLVERHLEMVRRLIGEHIRVELMPGHELGNVRVDRSQIEQVVLNLCLNARDAMTGGGRLMIELGNVAMGQEYIASHPWARPGRYVLLSVSDTGIGMDPETRARIFEPFFTTKPQGQGTGLGLSVVYGIVQQHGGLINVYSEPGFGTTFKLYFPIVERAAAAVGKQLEPTVPRGQGTVLLAEDEPGVREIAIKLLERAGYEVLAAEDGEEAVAQFRRHGDRISLVILDVVMPRMGGFHAADAIKALQPAVPVLFCSGYSGSVLSNGGELPEGAHFLHKPYSYDQLLYKIGEMLGGGQST